MNKHRALKYGIGDFKELWQLDYIKENSKSFFLVMLASALWYTLFIASFYLLIKPSMPETVAEQYIIHLKNKDYKRAVDCYTSIPSGVGTGYSYIKSVLDKKYDEAYDISIKSVEKSSDPLIYRALIEVKKGSSMFEDSFYLYNTGSSLFSIKKEWKVIFPFNTRDIAVESAEGAAILIDGIESGEIKGGKLTVSQVICGEHNFEAKLNSIAKSDSLNIEISESTGIIEMGMIFHEDFRKSIDKLLSDFIKGWSDYCLTQNPDKLKPYLTDRLYVEYTKGSDRFNGSKYVVSECGLGQGELETGAVNTVSYTVEEKWHLKEIITSPELVFKDNYKSQLEQTQYIKSRYHIVNDKGTWKIDSAKQLDFKQEIK